MASCSFFLSSQEILSNEWMLLNSVFLCDFVSWIIFVFCVDNVFTFQNAIRG